MTDLLGLTGEPALVVGGGYGIGRATAVLLAHAAYGAAKAGVNSLARSLSDEWAGRDIRLNTVAPDIIATQRLVNSFPGPGDPIETMNAMAAADGVPMAASGSRRISPVRWCSCCPTCRRS